MTQDIAAALRAAERVVQLFEDNSGDARDEAWDLLSKHADDICRALLQVSSPRETGGEVASDVRDAFEEWATQDHRRLDPLEFEERTPGNNHYYEVDKHHPGVTQFEGFLIRWRDMVPG